MAKVISAGLKGKIINDFIETAIDKYDIHFDNSDKAALRRLLTSYANDTVLEQDMSKFGIFKIFWGARLVELIKETWGYMSKLIDTDKIFFPHCRISSSDVEEIIALSLKNPWQFYKIVHTINLSYNPICDSGLKAIAFNIRHFPSLKSLSLDGCGITSDGVLHLANNLLLNLQLDKPLLTPRELSLQSNNIDEYGKKALIGVKVVARLLQMTSITREVHREKFLDEELFLKLVKFNDNLADPDSEKYFSYHILKAISNSVFGIHNSSIKVTNINLTSAYCVFRLSSHPDFGKALDSFLEGQPLRAHDLNKLNWQGLYEWMIADPDDSKSVLPELYLDNADKEKANLALALDLTLINREAVQKSFFAIIEEQFSSKDSTELGPEPSLPSQDESLVDKWQEIIRKGTQYKSWHVDSVINSTKTEIAKVINSDEALQKQLSEVSLNSLPGDFHKLIAEIIEAKCGASLTMLKSELNKVRHGSLEEEAITQKIAALEKMQLVQLQELQQRFQQIEEDIKQNTDSLVAYFEQNFISMESSAAQHLNKLLRLDQEDAAAKEIINSNPLLIMVYEGIQRGLNSVYIAASATATEYIDLNSEGVLKQVGSFMTAISSSVPIGGLGLSFLGNLCQKIADKQQAQKFDNFLQIATNSTHFAIIVEHLARKVALQLNKAGIAQSDSQDDSKEFVLDIITNIAEAESLSVDNLLGAIGITDAIAGMIHQIWQRYNGKQVVHDQTQKKAAEVTKLVIEIICKELFSGLDTGARTFDEKGEFLFQEFIKPYFTKGAQVDAKLSDIGRIFHAVSLEFTFLKEKIITHSETEKILKSAERGKWSKIAERDDGNYLSEMLSRDSLLKNFAIEEQQLDDLCKVLFESMLGRVMVSELQRYQCLTEFIKLYPHIFSQEITAAAAAGNIAGLLTLLTESHNDDHNEEANKLQPMIGESKGDMADLEI